MHANVRFDIRNMHTSPKFYEQTFKNTIFVFNYKHRLIITTKNVMKLALLSSLYILSSLRKPLNRQ